MPPQKAVSPTASGLHPIAPPAKVSRGTPIRSHAAVAQKIPGVVKVQAYTLRHHCLIGRVTWSTFNP